MNLQEMNQIFEETAYVRTGGSAEEKKCAAYIKEKCKAFGLTATEESFEVEIAEISEAKLVVNGKEIPCKGYLCAGSSEVEAPLYYLTNTDKYSLSCCNGKIVMIDGYLGYWKYRDMLENGAVGFITYDGDANYADNDIDQRELRSYISKGDKIPGVNINAKDAIALIRDDAQTAKIVLKQDEKKGTSQNLILDIPGESDEVIVLTAHYDSTWLSEGAYDNMSGCVGLLELAERFSKTKNHYSLRFIWCGSEERGLLGSKAYTAADEERLQKMILNVNLDMIGCIMGNFIACCTSEEKLVHYIEYFSSVEGFGMKAYQGVYSSDSTPFADKGIPAVSFARIAPKNTATIHNSYDTRKVMKVEQLQIDIDFIYAFVNAMVNAKKCPVAKEMPDKMKEKLDEYLVRKRGA